MVTQEELPRAALWVALRAALWGDGDTGGAAEGCIVGW